MPEPTATAAAVPATEHAIQIVAPGEIVHNRAKPVPAPGPTQVLLRIEAVGICFSDTKLLHAFTAHPRKGNVSGGLSQAALAEIPSYVPGELPTVPGHEVVARIVAVGAAVERHRVGERVLVQTDYRHLATERSNAAFGYNFEGGLQEYVIVDERVVIEPGTGERFLIPVDEVPSASAVALLEPWACVEASYTVRERGTLLRGGRLLLVADPGTAVRGIDELLAASGPGSVTAVVADDAQAAKIKESLAKTGLAMSRADVQDTLPAAAFDDIVYFGSDADRIEALERSLAPRGILDIVLAGARIGRPVAVDVGRVHYDLTRWVGTTGDSAADGYAWIPRDGELRAGDREAIIGAAGPMGFMHAIRAVTSGLAGLDLTAIDIDDARLAHLAEVAGPLAVERGVSASFLNSRTDAPQPGFSYLAVMVPAPALVISALDLAGPGARVNLFAGFAVGTMAPLDLNSLLSRRAYLFGTSGSEIDDMKAVLAKLERGDLDTNLSLDAVTGMEGVRDALAAVEARTSGGKIVVYPGLPEMGMIPLAELAQRLPTVAALMRGGRWTRDAEAELLAQGGSARRP